MDIANVMILVGRMAGHTQNDDYPLTLVIILLLVGLGALSLGILGAVNTQQRLARMVRAQGKVVECASYEDREGDLHFTLTIEFRAANGEVVRFKSSTGEKRRIGDTVGVRYDPQTPQSAEIESNPWTDVFALNLSWQFLYPCNQCFAARPFFR